jgi:M6 family metalloprotease-like protein
MKKIISIISSLFIVALLCAAPLRNIPQTVIQPNGDTLQCFASGDEFFNYLHDANGYTIIQDPVTGYYVYAIPDGDDIKASSYIAGKVDPAQLNLKKQTLPSERVLRKIISAQRALLKAEEQPALSNLKNAPPNYARNQGTLNNIVIFIRFSDEESSVFSSSLNSYENIFNTGNASMKAYYNEASYGLISIPSTYYPAPNGTTILSYQDNRPRAYYKKYSTSNPSGYSGDNDRTNREHNLLRNAVGAISAQIPASLNLDMNNDGKVDNVTFIISGNSDGWNDLLWPHRWALYTSPSVYINGKQVYDFIFIPANSLSVSTLCHEMFHALGAPDLYHYYNYTNLSPVFSWDIMEQNTNPAQHMGAYMKYKYGNWINTIPTITTSGVYTLNPVNTSSTGIAYKIPIPNRTDQFYIVEYRKKTAGNFESSIPGSGLIIQRINSRFDGNADYNGSTVYDEIYVFRPSGTKTNNGSPNRAHFSSDEGRTAFNINTNPYPFLCDGTEEPSISIYNITNAGTTISFTVGFPESIEITMPDLINIGESVPLSATASSGNSIIWSIVSGADKAHIDGNYLIGDAGGAVTIKATDSGNSTVSDSKQITVRQPVTAISITADDIIPLSKKYYTLTANVSPSNAMNKNLTWSVTGISGSASVNGASLKLERAGYIILKATAVDGSGVENEKQVFITDDSKPNPVKTYWGANNGADGLFHVENPEGIGRIEVYATTGAMVKEMQGSTALITTQISFSSLPQGVYIVKIWNGNRTKESTIKVFW